MAITVLRQLKNQGRLHASPILIVKHVNGSYDVWDPLNLELLEEELSYSQLVRLIAHMAGKCWYSFMQDGHYCHHTFTMAGEL